MEPFSLQPPYGPKDSEDLVTPSWSPEQWAKAAVESGTPNVTGAGDDSRGAASLQCDEWEGFCFLARFRCDAGLHA